MTNDINPSEILSILKEKISGFGTSTKETEVGRVILAGDGIAQAWGLDQIMMGELVEIESSEPGITASGMVMNLEEDTVSIILFDNGNMVKEGNLVKRTKRVAEVPAGDGLLGRIVDALGKPLDGKGPIAASEFRRVEAKGPGIIDRQNVGEPMQTGIKAIDSMIPIGRGQRELIIGDRRTGKTTIAIDAIINQKSADPAQRVHCFYVAIGQKRSSVVQLAETLRRHGVLEFTTIVAATASDPASMQFLAPYAATAMAEYYRDTGRHALVIYDDLTKHSQAYRELSLLMRRSPGREAYPGDIFYLHSRLLERAAKMSAQRGAGSLTALPVVETQEGDVSAYIPTNVISITDGQIFLEANLFNSGLRPAINVGISVSRVGGDAQIKAMKQTASSLRIDLAQFRELAAFMQFSSDLDPATQKQLARGERLTEILKQGQYAPIEVFKQVLIIKAGISGRLDRYPSNKLLSYQGALFDWLDKHEEAFMSTFRQVKAFTPEINREVEAVFGRFEENFHPETIATGIDAGYTLNLAMALSQKSTGINRDMLNMVERVTARELASPSLEKELEEIIEGKDELEKDQFEKLLAGCTIVDYNKTNKLEELVKLAANHLAREDKTLDTQVLAEMLIKREQSSSTALNSFFALPHIILEGNGKFQLFLVRSKKGIYFSDKAPAVHAVFFLAGSMDKRHLHLVMISSIAQIVRNQGFEKGWLSARNTEELRSLIQGIRSSLRK